DWLKPGKALLTPQLRNPRCLTLATVLTCPLAETAARLKAMAPAAANVTHRFISVPLVWVALSAPRLTIFSSVEGPLALLRALRCKPFVNRVSTGSCLSQTIYGVLVSRRDAVG